MSSRYFFSPVKRHKILKNIQQRMDKTNQLGGYRYVGEWGVRVKKQHEHCTNRYNKLKFFWQPRKQLNSTCTKCTWISWTILLLLIVFGTIIINRLYV